MYDNRYKTGIFPEGVTPELGLCQLGTCSIEIKEKWSAAPSDTFYLFSSIRSPGEASPRLAWQLTSVIKDPGSSHLSASLPSHAVFRFHSLTYGRCKITTVFPDLFSASQKGEADKSEGTKPDLFIWEWVPCTRTSAKNTLLRTVSHTRCQLQGRWGRQMVQ